MKSGWVSIHRKILEKGYYKKSEYVHLWLHILLKANHKETEFMWNNKTITVKEGQFITGRKQLSEETGINQTTIERILTFFENEHQIGQQKTTKWRMISIVKWVSYQKNEQQNGQQADNKRTTSGQQADTNNNVYNINKLYNENNKREENSPASDEIQNLWIKTWGRNPKLPEVEETEKLISKFGYEKTYKIMKESALKNFRNFHKLINSLDENGNITENNYQNGNGGKKCNTLIINN